MSPAPGLKRRRRSSPAGLLVLALLLVPSIAGASLLGIEIAGQPGSVPWNVADIKPGFHGNGTVTITNPGQHACSVVVWVGNVTGDRALGQYLRYRVASPRLATSMTFPATIYEFPQGPDSPQRITVSPVSAGETVTVDWTWEFQETGRPQNEAQAKRLGFVVYYTLLCPPPDLSGWYDVSPRVFRLARIPGDPCYLMNQTLQEYRIYTCTEQGCSYVVPDHRWLDLGTVLLDEDGDGVCDGDRTPTPTGTRTVPSTTAVPATTVPTTVPATTVPATTVPSTTGQTMTLPTTAFPKTTVPTGTVPGVRPTPVPTIDTALCPPLVEPSGPVTEITGPAVITAPGYYVLDPGAVNTTAPVYIEVRSSGVTIDGMGRTIDGVDGHGTYGILVRGDGPLERVVVQNVTVNDFAYGIALVETSHSRVNRVGATSCTYDGVMVLGGGDNEIVCSLIDRDDDGINLTATRGTRVALNTVTANVRGSGIHAGPGCAAVTVVGNIVGGNDEGIEVEYARDVVIRSNRIYASRFSGLNLTGAEALTVVDNFLENRENVDRHAGAFSGAWSQEPAPGPNVMGNPLVGGNYWGTPDGTGFSDVTPDRNRDGFADGSYVLPYGLGTDFHPLGPPLSLPARPAGTITGPGTTATGVSGAAGTGGAAIGAGEEPTIGGSGSGSPVAAGGTAAEQAGADTTPTLTAPGAPAGTEAGGPVSPVPGLALGAGLALLLIAGLIVRRRRR